MGTLVGTASTKQSDEHSIRTICVFCGASDGNSPIYREQASVLGAEIARRKIKLVYGGGNIGVMGALARSVHENGGEVVGVIPKFMTTSDVMEGTVGETHVVESMHDRKILLADLSDAFIAAPGGYGTLDELFEMVCRTQLGIQKKKVGLFNVNGFFDSMISMIDHMVEEGFVGVEQRHAVLHDSTAHGILDELEKFTLPFDGVYSDTLST